MTYNLELSLTEEEAAAFRVFAKSLSGGKEYVMLRLKITEALLDAVDAFKPTIPVVAPK